MARIAFQTAMRAAAVTLLEGYADDVNVVPGTLKLQIYRARPASIQPPCAFVDSMSEDIRGTPGLMERVVTVDVIVLHGVFDQGETVDQRDRFVDGFVDWVWDHREAADPNAVIEPRDIEDIPVFVADWIRLQPNQQPTSYFGTRISLEGFEQSG